MNYQRRLSRHRNLMKLLILQTRLFVESTNCIVDYYGIVRTRITASILSNNSLALWMNRNERMASSLDGKLLELKLVGCFFMFLFLSALFIQSTIFFSRSLQSLIHFSASESFSQSLKTLMKLKINSNADFQCMET